MSPSRQPAFLSGQVSRSREFTGAALAGTTARVTAVRDQYERWPYPRVPLLARMHREHLWQLNLDWLAPRCGRNLPVQSRIWLAGCGTFQPYVFARANPQASILATDLSHRSLEIARRRCRWHGIRDLSFARIDLENENELPPGPFDLIECYGVLMSLRDPVAALRRMARRLAPQGILRLMVYPHYSRRRIFQIQRLAKLLGLHAGESSHPQLLRNLMRALPPSHPLRVTFFRYPDASSEVGIVDGFLHARDRGFRASELFALASQAGLTPAFYFHRPWGQPQFMGPALGMQGATDAAVLEELDLWQELRTNFIVCFVRNDSPSLTSREELPPKHPLFDLANRAVGWRHRARLLRLAATGAILPSRTHVEPIRVNGRTMRALLNGNRAAFDGGATHAAGEILPRFYSCSPQAPAAPFSPNHEEPLPFRAGPIAPNPLYAHLFDAWRARPLGEQIRRWEKFASPLEDEKCPMGLTPWGTLLSRREEIEQGLQVWETTSPKPLHRIRLREEKSKHEQLRDFLRRFPRLPENSQNEERWRELWILLFSFPQLLLPLEKD